ncbi:MAG: hypothetical protein J7K29_03220 [Candidatus Cloacimonetes bacterium]|nr:hypothetical protein [Candidatus Cloacimonadota bacterium]
MRKIIVFLTVLFLLGACAKQSELTIYNDTGHSVKVIFNGTIHHLLSNDPPAVEIFYLNSFILFGETINVPIIIERQIYLEPKNFTIEMKPNKDKSYHVEFDRAGLQINNVSIYPIGIIQLRKDGDEEWSENVIEEILYSETLGQVFSITPDYDFIKITDTFENEYQEELIELNAGETTTYIFTG